MEERIKEIINETVEASGIESGESIWRTPIIGSVLADHPGFSKLKDIVSPTHTMPEELLPSVVSVIVFFIPFSRKVVESNIDGSITSALWATAYLRTNQLIEEIGDRLAGEVVKVGGHALSIRPTHNFDQQTLMSDWSHRHIAQLAGLGTFGLNHMLITRSGCCGRLGSVLTTIPVVFDAGMSGEACLFYRNGSCQACLARCPIRALSVDRFDRHRCYRLCLANARRYADQGLTDVCGKCLVNLPCSMAYPE